MKPLRITFTLRSPMVLPERPIHLDSIVGCAAYRNAERSGAADPRTELDSLPFARATGPDGQWVWQASQLLLEQEGGIFWTHYVRSYEVNAWAAGRERGHWQGNKNAIRVGSGPMKAFAITQPMGHIRRAVAWGVGDADAIDFLLRQEIVALGRNTRQGWGRIDSIAIEDAPAGEEGFWQRRVLPQSLGEFKLPGHYAGTASVRPPYWDRSQWQPIWEYEPEPAPANVAVA